MRSAKNQYKYVSVNNSAQTKPEAKVQASPGAVSTAVASSNANKARKSLVKSIIDQRQIEQTNKKQVFQSKSHKRGITIELEDAEGDNISKKDGPFEQSVNDRKLGTSFKNKRNDQTPSQLVDEARSRSNSQGKERPMQVFDDNKSNISDNAGKILVYRQRKSIIQQALEDNMKKKKNQNALIANPIAKS